MLGQRLFIFPTKVKIFRVVYKYIIPTKGKIFCDGYKYINPTKGKIFWDVYNYITPTKRKIFCDVYKYRIPPKGTWGTAFKKINVLIAICEIKKPSPSPQLYPSLQGKQIRMSSLEYSPLEICDHIRGKSSVSMYADPINMIHTSQQSARKGLNEYLEGYVINYKEQ